MTGVAPTQAHRVAELIEAEILAGQRQPGSHLNEQEIARRYSVSRTPVREAMRYLSSEGLIEVRPRRGAFVASISVERLLRMFEVMTELEGVAARLATRRMSDDAKKRLRETHESYRHLADGDDPLAYYDASLDFHRQLFAGARNEVLEEMALKLFERLAVFRKRQIQEPNRTRASFQEHEAILQAIESGDPNEAEKLTRQHTGMVEGGVVDLIATLDQ